MASQQERKKNTRLKIIAAAKELFEKQGFENSSVEQIFKQANIAKGTFYKHFDTKLDVFIALEKENSRHMTRPILQDIANGADVFPILENYMDVLGEWFEAREKIAHDIILTQMRKPSHEEEHSDPETSMRGFLYSLITSAQQQKQLRNDLSAYELASMLGGFIVITIINWCQQPQAGQLANRLRKALALFLEGAQYKDN